MKKLLAVCMLAYCQMLAFAYSADATSPVMGSCLAHGKEAVSPDGRNRITYSGGMVTVFRDNRTLFGPQPAALRLDRGEAEVELCARNDGVAYRFRTDEDGEITVLDETAAASSSVSHVEAKGTPVGGYGLCIMHG